jgi:hypothetical protein
VWQAQPFNLPYARASDFYSAPQLPPPPKPTITRDVDVQESKYEGAPPPLLPQLLGVDPRSATVSDRVLGIWLHTHNIRAHRLCVSCLLPMAIDSFT